MNRATEASLSQLLHLCFVCLFVALSSAVALAQLDLASSMRAASSADTASASASGSALTVTYQNGLLSIDANHCSLRAILDEVRSKTGATVDITGGTPQGSVVAHLGPGQPASVISSLLYGTDWNYAVLESASQPGKIEQILVMRQTAAPAQNASVSPRPMMIAPPAAATIAEAKPSDDAAENSGDKKDADGKEAKKKDDKADADKNEEAKADGKDSVKDKDKEVADAGKDSTKENAEDAEANAEVPVAPAFPASLYKMYPKLFGGGDTSLEPASSAVAGGSSGSTQSLYAAMAQANGGSNPTQITQLQDQTPTVPRNYPPELWKLYPPNLVDLIRNAPSVPAPVVVNPNVQYENLYWIPGIH